MLCQQNTTGSSLEGVQWMQLHCTYSEIKTSNKISNILLYLSFLSNVELSQNPTKILHLYFENLNNDPAQNLKMRKKEKKIVAFFSLSCRFCCGCLIPYSEKWHNTTF